MTRRPPARHRRPVPRWQVVGLAAVDASVAVLALLAIGNVIAPRVDAADVSAVTLPAPEVTDPARRGGPIGPLAMPSVGADNAWTPDKGPVVVDGRPLPRVTATPQVTQPPADDVVPVVQVEELTGSTSSSQAETVTFAGITVTTSTSSSATEETTSETSTSTTSTSSSSANPDDLIDTVTPEPAP